MRSTTGAYYEALDHVRALAAFLVFAWHFVHTDGIVPYASVPANPLLSLFEEGHVGVGLFMTLSGYVFAKLIDGRVVRIVPFLWNRAIRLLPLLAFVFLLVLAHDLLLRGGGTCRCGQLGQTYRRGDCAANLAKRRLVHRSRAPFLCDPAPSPCSREAACCGPNTRPRCLYHHQSGALPQ